MSHRYFVCLLLLATASTSVAAAEHTIRIATFNVSLHRNRAGELAEDLSGGEDLQIRRVAEIIQRTRPNVLLLNEFDYDATGESLKLFQRNYLGKSQSEHEPIQFEYTFAPPVNTGKPSRFDLNRNGRLGDWADAWGYGSHHGQYGLVVLSQYPIDKAAIRTFQNFLWQDMPDALLPDDPSTIAEGDYYAPEVLAKFPLSSKTHADVPIRIGDQTLHFLVSHPTPPVFDGAEDRNGRRNHDEVRFWHDYITLGAGDYIYDDAKQEGPLSDSASFVIAGDLNSDPHDGDSTSHPVRLLLNSPRVQSQPVPASDGAVEAAAKFPAANAKHLSKPQYDTGDFGRVGNMRLDYVLPSKDLTIKASGVFWPAFGENAQRAEALLVRRASDHRLVWVDLELD